MDTGLTLGVGATLAALVAIIKSAVPDIPSRALPLLVLALAVVVVGVGAWSGEVQGTPFGLLAQVVGQTVAALGIREGIVAAAPRVSGGIPK